MDYHICVFTEEEIAAGCMLYLINKFWKVIKEDNIKATAECGLDFIKEAIVICITDGSILQGKDIIKEYDRHHSYCFFK